MKLFWAGLATGIALGVLGYKAATSDEVKNAIETCRIKCYDTIGVAVAALND